MEVLFKIVDFISNLATIIASGIAIYLFFFKRKALVSTFNWLMNYSIQLTLSDLVSKLERLNEYNASAGEHKIFIINILSEIYGQIKGNKALSKQLEKQLDLIGGYIKKSDTLTEPLKRSLVSELRESIRNLDVNNYKRIME